MARDIEQELGRLATALEAKRGRFPRGVHEIPDFPCSNFGDLSLAFRDNKFHLKRFTYEFIPSIFKILATTSERFYMMCLHASNVVIPVVSLALGYLVSWWFLLSLSLVFLTLSKIKKLYNSVIFHSAFGSEAAFCFLYRIGQISMVTTDFEVSYYWSGETSAKMESEPLGLREETREPIDLSKEANDAYSIDDFDTAQQLFKKLADQGDADAALRLGFMNDQGRGMSQDYTEAAKWYRLSAERGNASAQFCLGYAFSRGRGVAQDFAEAMKWFNMAADQGETVAQVELGVMYANGWGVPQDDVEAANRYREAAEQGNADAQIALGSRYRQGKGVPQDLEEAANWYRMAADQKHAEAQCNLGLMYGAGQGVPLNNIEAYKWLYLSATMIMATDETRERANKACDLVAAKLTPEQIAEAEQLAEDWDPLQ